MVTIVTLANTASYAIYVDNCKIVECNQPETTFNELIKNIGIDTSNVQVIEMQSFPVTLRTIAGAILQDIIAETTPVAETSNLDNIIDLVNASMTPTSKPNRPTLSVPDLDLDLDEPEDFVADNETSTADDNNAPIGNIEIPKVGNLIYVDGVDGFLRKITGGIGTVHIVYNADNKAEHVPANDDGLDDEDPRIIVELEEVPGVYFSWTELRNKQDELKTKYGYKPVCSII